MGEGHVLGKSADGEVRVSSTTGVRNGMAEKHRWRRQAEGVSPFLRFPGAWGAQRTVAGKRSPANGYFLTIVEKGKKNKRSARVRPRRFVTCVRRVVLCVWCGATADVVDVGGGGVCTGQAEACWGVLVVVVVVRSEAAAAVCV